LHVGMMACYEWPSSLYPADRPAYA
jgi:hypothetical protein